MADPLSIAASIAGLISLADTVFRHLFKYGRSASGSKEEIQSLAAEINGLSGVLRSLEALASELEADGQAFEPALRVHHLAHCRQVLEKIQKRVKKAADSFENKSKWEGFSRQLKWPFSASETKDLLAQVSRCKATIDLATSADTMRALQLCLAKQEEHGAKLVDMTEKLQKIEINTNILVDTKRRLTLDFFLKPETNPQDNLDQSIRLRYPTTGEWLTKSYAFTEWLQTPGSRLWLNGIPGGGKTVLAGAIIEEAIATSRSKPDVGVAFFFCDYKKEATLKPANILGAIASQLARQRDDVFELLQAYYDDLHPTRALDKGADVSELVRVIASMSELLSQVIIVIDGLDECGDNTTDMLDHLSDLADFTSTTTLAFLSRDEVDIRQFLEKDFKAIAIEAHTDDLELYVRAEIERRVRSGQLNIKNMRIKDQVQDELVNRASGMFRWVVCQLDFLSELPTDADRQLALTELPPTLSETYERLLKRVNKRPLKVQKMVQKCLRFIAFFPEKLSIAALCQAISTPETIGSQINESNTASERDIARNCSSLIRKSNDGESFEFAHFTVREFLENETQLRNIGLEAYQLLRSRNQGDLALECLRFIQMGNFDQVLSEHSMRDFVANLSQSYPFYAAACCYWMFLSKDGFQGQLILDTAKSLFVSTKKVIFSNWIYTLLSQMDPCFPSSRRTPEIHESHARLEPYFADSSMKPLHIASALNLPEICSYLIERGADVNMRCQLGTPLLLAEVSFLSFIEEAFGFHPDREPSLWNAVLPSSNRHEKTIACLVSAGASTDGLENYLHYSDIRRRSIFLKAGIIGCHTRTFKPLLTLLSNGIVPEYNDSHAFRAYLETWIKCDDSAELEGPLHCLFQFLNDSSAYADEWGFKLAEELWLAAVHLGFDFAKDATQTDTRISLSSPALVEMALVAITTDDAATLEVCLKDGRIDLTGWFEKRIDLTDDWFETRDVNGTLLHHAIFDNALRCARLLLDRGADPFIQDEDGHIPIFCCDTLGDGDALKLLHEYGVFHLVADPDEANIWHHCAIADQCSISFMNTLFYLDRPKSHEALLKKSDFGVTPLVAALYSLARAGEDTFCDREERVLAIIDYCHGHSSFWQLHEDVFPAACESGSTKVIKHLIELGLRPNPVQPGCEGLLHRLGEMATVELTHLVKEICPGALDLRYNNRLPLELYIERMLDAGALPRWKVVEALTFPDIFGCLDDQELTPWEFISGLKDASEEVRKEIWDNLWSNLLELKAMEAYEMETHRCGVYCVLLPPAQSAIGAYMISTTTLNRLIESSKYWDPNHNTVVSYFKRAISAEDTPTIQALLKHGFNVNERENLLSSIEYACEPHLASSLCSYGRNAILELLLDHCDSGTLNEFSVDGRAYTLLHRLAASDKCQGKLWLMGQLIERGADVNAINYRAPVSTRMPPLIWHLRNQSFSCAEFLLEKGANPLLTGQGSEFWSGSNAIGAAVGLGNEPFLRKLLAFSKENSIELDWKGSVDFRLRDLSVRGATYLHDLCSKGVLDCVEFFVERQLIDNLNVVTDEGRTPLHCAALTNKVKVVEFLISKGCAVDVRDFQGRTALHYAVGGKSFQSVETLLRSGASNTADNYGKTPLMYSHDADNDTCTELLEQRFGSTHPSQEVNLVANESKFLTQQLGKAIEQDDIEQCRCLLGKGAPLNAPLLHRITGFEGLRGLSALSYAILLERFFIAEWLIKNKAEVQAPCGHQFGRITSVIERASKEKSFISILPSILAQYTASGGDWLDGRDAPLLFAVEGKNFDGLKAIIRHLERNAAKIGSTHSLSGFEVVALVLNRQFRFRYSASSQDWCSTALQLAVRRGYSKTAEFLIKKGADLDCLDLAGLSCLFYTASPEMTKFLIQSGASLTPILTQNIPLLLRYWGHNGNTIFELYSKACFEVWGCSLSEIGDLLPMPCWDEWRWNGHDPFEATRIMGFELNNLNSASANHINQYLSRDEIQSFFLNSEYEIQILGQMPWNWMSPRPHSFPPLNTTFRQFRRRFSHYMFKRWLNLEPETGWSPLCRAASEGRVQAMENCLSMDADINFEGCPFGSALMIASACGRLESVILLIRRGAAVCYNGRRGPINVFSSARSNAVKRWLLVDRFKDQPRIQSAGAQKTSPSPSQVKFWSGTARARYKLSGIERRWWNESTLGYATRLAYIKQELRGRILLRVEGLIFSHDTDTASDDATSSQETRSNEEYTLSSRRDYKVGQFSEEAGCEIARAALSSSHSQSFIPDELPLTDGTYHQPGGQGFTVTLRNGAEAEDVRKS